MDIVIIYSKFVTNALTSEGAVQNQHHPKTKVEFLPVHELSDDKSLVIECFGEFVDQSCSVSVNFNIRFKVPSQINVNDPVFKDGLNSVSDSILKDYCKHLKISRQS